jgi:preprotein translocase subunit SecA
MRIFYRDWVTNAMKRLGMGEDVPIESGMVTRAIERAQKKVEERNFETRKSLLEYDEVMNQQRKVVYGVRQFVLQGKNVKPRITEMIDNVLRRMAEVFVEDTRGFREWCHKSFGFEIPDEESIADAVAKQGDCSKVIELVHARYDEREKQFGEELMRRIERYLLLNAIDSKWKDHLYAIDALKAGIGLRGYGQEDPKTAYKKEGTDLFEQKLLPAIEDEVSSLILRIQIAQPQAPATAKPGASPGQTVAAAPAAGPALTPRGMGQGVAGPAPTPEQVEAYRREMRRRQAQQLMRSSVPATSAFDVMRRRQALASARDPGDGAAKAANAAPSPARAPETKPAPQPEQATVPAVGRNDVCPCGSGKKFKKCHGKA